MSIAASTSSASRRARLVGLALAVLAFVAFCPALGYGFVYDDDLFVVQSPTVRAGLSPQGLRAAWETRARGTWHPLTWLSLQLDYQLWGMNPRGFHLTNILLHAANTALLFVALRRMTGALWRSALVAALFALHPLHVESVAWVFERKDVLSTFFGLLATWAYVRYAERPGTGRYLMVALPYLLALLAKPMLVTLPFVFLLLDYWPLGRLRPSALGTRHSALRLVVEKFPLLALAAASSAMTLFAWRDVVGSAERYPLAVRAENALVVYASYLAKTVWPVGLAPLYPHPGAGLTPAAVAGAGLFLVLMTALVLWAGRRHPYLPVGWFWYLGTLVPVIGLVQVGDYAMADRFTYVPLVGIFLMLSWGLGELVTAHRLPAGAAAGAAVVAVTACAVVTFQIALPVWQNSQTLWQHTVRVTGPNPVAHYNLGVALQRAGHADRAEREYRQAIREDEHFWQPHLNLAAILSARADWREAASEYEECLRLNPDSPEAHLDFALVLLKLGDVPQAGRHARQALQIDDGLAAAHDVLGYTLIHQGRMKEGNKECERALALDPHLAEAHDHLGTAYALEGDWARAAQHYRRAVEREPTNGAFLYDLAHAVARQGNRPEAQTLYRRAYQRDPGWPAELYQDARRLAADPDAGARNGRLAVLLAEELCEAADAVGMRRPDFLNTLAAAYAEAGEFDQAQQVQSAALGQLSGASLPPEQARKVRQEMEDRLRLYRKKQPFHESAASAGR